MSEFLAMGGHGPYVWSAYGVTLVVMVYNAWAAYRHQANALNRLQHTEAEQEIRAKPTVRQIG